ncbi:MAG: ATP-binding cassette domain-containing protein [Elusimicrobia bacterium]|nr:ATP-binding cassette domain-containing protein [Elusimicrobiota bacterium]MBD3412559.1 ATP-binding cassette domain-containing protein [Elusimicrobiota bacterium]
MSDIIRTENIFKTYAENGLPVHAVNGVSIRISPGEFTAIVGPSGSGKTTLLNIISGLDTPNQGTVWLNEKKVNQMSGRELSDFRRDNIGFIFQSYNLIPVLTVNENIEYIMLLQHVPPDERKKRVDAILADVGLEGFAHRLPTQISGGQQQRVAIARAMVSHPSIIMADEPTANLDSKTASELLDIMHALNDKTGMTFVFSTHDRMIMERARRLIQLKDGTVERDERTNH